MPQFFISFAKFDQLGVWQNDKGGVISSFSGSFVMDDMTGMQTSISFSYPAFERLRDQNQTLASVANLS
jgi:hypothetical protein